MVIFRNLLDYAVVYKEVAGLRTSRVRSWDQSHTQRHGRLFHPCVMLDGELRWHATRLALFAHAQQQISQQWTPLLEGKMTLIFSYIFSPSSFSLLLLTIFDVITILAEVSDPNVRDNIDRRAGMYVGRTRSWTEMRTGIS